MAQFDWQEKLKPLLPTEWLASEGKGVKIAVLDSGLNLTLPIYQHFAGAIGHRYNAALPGDRLLFLGNDNVSEQGVEQKEHGTSCLSIISGLQDGVFKGIAPQAEIFVIKVSRLLNGAASEVFRITDLLNGLKIAKGLNVDFSVVALTYSKSLLEDFDITPALANQVANEYINSGGLLFSTLRNYEPSDGSTLSQMYFPSWHPQSINSGCVPADLQLYERLQGDNSKPYFWSNFLPTIVNGNGIQTPDDLSNSFATYATAGLAALALGHLKATEQNNYHKRNRAEMIELLNAVAKPASTASQQSGMVLLNNAVLV